MATYNGERYLKDQIDSLLAQTFNDWHLYVHDDGSTDGTVGIVEACRKDHPEKVTLLDYPSEGSPCRNFLSLLDSVEADYYMFCDQDDIWLPEKIEVSMNELKTREQAAPGKGIVVCTDLSVVDEQLQLLNGSMWEYLSIYPQYIRTFRDSGASAIATGCTMLFNGQAKADCQPCTPSVMMHDCWVVLCTLKAQGQLHGIARQLVRYRQHGNNSMGVGVSSSQITLVYRLRHFLKLYQYNADYYRMLRVLDYGSVFKYLAAKIRYRQRIKRGYY
jgi:rhamnosyltransferase